MQIESDHTALQLIFRTLPKLSQNTYLLQQSSVDQMIELYLICLTWDTGQK